MPLYKFIYIFDPNKETQEMIENNLVAPEDLAHIFFEAEGDVEANGFIEDTLHAELKVKRGGVRLEGWAWQRGDRASTEDNFTPEASSAHALFVTATMRPRLGEPFRSALKDAIHLW